MISDARRIQMEGQGEMVEYKQVKEREGRSRFMRVCRLAVNVGRGHTAKSLFPALLVARVSAGNGPSPPPCIFLRFRD